MLSFVPDGKPRRRKYLDSGVHLLNAGPPTFPRCPHPSLLHRGQCLLRLIRGKKARFWRARGWQGGQAREENTKPQVCFGLTSHLSAAAGGRFREGCSQGAGCPWGWGWHPAVPGQSCIVPALTPHSAACSLQAFGSVSAASCSALSVCPVFQLLPGSWPSP